jgi:hypothetical protein
MFRNLKVPKLEINTGQLGCTAVDRTSKHRTNERRTNERRNFEKRPNVERPNIECRTNPETPRGLNQA